MLARGLVCERPSPRLVRHLRRMSPRPLTFQQISSSSRARRPCFVFPSLGMPTASSDGAVDIMRRGHLARLARRLRSAGFPLSPLHAVARSWTGRGQVQPLARQAACCVLGLPRLSKGI
ncbi:hypothetical protein BV20DRAFT_133545 [Pilatotrama ljubarskyi]|nr:hypothetical protein BV20DRAFT_133545 [Pilatotrama ljubarskyi]